jgi:hypothetical protein
LPAAVAAMTVKSGTTFVPGHSIEKFLLAPPNPDTMDESSDRTFGARHDAGVDQKNSSARLSFSVDSLLSTIHSRGKGGDDAGKQEADVRKPETELRKPEVDEDDDNDEDLDVEDDSDDYADDDDEAETASNRSNPVHPDYPVNPAHPAGMPPFLAAFLAAAASSNSPAGHQFRSVPNWPVPGSGFPIGFPGLAPHHHPLFKGFTFQFHNHNTYEV